VAWYLLSSLSLPVVFPIRLCPTDVFLLALLCAAREQNYKPFAISPEVKAVAGAKINFVFENAGTDCLDGGQVALRHAFKRRRYFRRVYI
jgi:hypothetical protein